MKSGKLKKLIICCSYLLIPFLITGCSSRIIEYSSIANHDLKVSALRTEMLIIKGEDDNIRRDFYVVSAVDYLPEGKKTYYLMIVPAKSSSIQPVIEDLILHYDYPYIIQAQNIKEFIANLEKCFKEWDSRDLQFSGSVFNFSAFSNQDTRTWFEGDIPFETTPYVKFNYSKTQYGAIAKLALGERTEEVIYSVVDGKTVKNKIFYEDYEESWFMEDSEQIKDFHNLLTKGYLDLKGKGMEDPAGRNEKKTEIIPQEVKTEVISQEEIKEVTPVQVEKKKPKGKRKRKR